MTKVLTLFKLLPKKHQIVLSVLVLLTTLSLFFPSEEAEASRQYPSEAHSEVDFTIPLSQRVPHPPKGDEVSFGAPNGESEPEDARSNRRDELKQASKTANQNEPQGTNREVEHFEVARGDTLATLFQRADLTSGDVHEISQLPEARKNLLTIMPGEEIAIVKDAEGKFAELNYRIDAVSTLVIAKTDTGYSEKIEVKQLTTRTEFAQNTIRSNFWSSAVDAGLNASQIMDLATIFGWDIDFAQDLQKGDSFALLYEKHYADDTYVRSGNILAAEFINNGERFTAIRYDDGNYYSETGQGMRKAFLRSPVDFKYVSSNFNPKRLHPVTGQVKAHRGVDYVAAIGTPIKAAGGGKVVEAGYNQYNGNYVFIKHNSTYTTKYLHLNKYKVKRGDTVKQGQIIGTLGKTGRVTGAHLHYEFIVNGVHRNPRTVDLPKADSIGKKEQGKFNRISKDLMAKIEFNKQQQLAMKSQEKQTQ
ncbi:peptidoglycan DD-metalloendopeptidase family protein [Shewanella sp. JM162201]|uniref:Peptidoglycan DD-metalloendopeptidase family protein n=1 Tax=Shewanella jiangmenensis TaxID=2837387 RepID=A0ABS5V1Y1_9GAMM|nr:peptidoglycan DD-metalloendopeptidase family protein [Shewanella jiangmenensis]MBT1444474.1 peptidoglycan DD-metalloendopeptidase family protein [Shewanella jiangmenensis]